MKGFKYGNVQFVDKGWSKFMRGVDQLDKRAVKVGFLHSSPEHKAEEGKRPVNIMQLAAVHEFGAPHAGKGGMTKIPPRPFIRPTAEAKRDYFQGMQKRFLERIVADFARGKGGTTVNTALGQMGERMVGFIQKAIVDLKNPPNALATQRAKGRKLRGRGTRALFMNFGGRVKRGRKIFSVALVDNPLIDTGQMRQSVRWGITSNPAELRAGL